MLDGVVPGGLDYCAEVKLFRPLCVTNYQWQYTPEHVVGNAGGIRMNSLGFARYGQLYKNGRLWKGPQIIPQEGVNTTFTKHKAITGTKNEFYGYLFWNKTYHSKNKDYEAYYSSGNGGNKIFIFKNQPLVVVITATVYGSGAAHTQTEQILEQYILPAIY